MGGTCKAVPDENPKKVLTVIVELEREPTGIKGADLDPDENFPQLATFQLQIGDILNVGNTITVNGGDFPMNIETNSSIRIVDIVEGDYVPPPKPAPVPKRRSVED